MSDHLVEIPPEDWQQLRSLYKSDEEKSYIAYCTIDNYIRFVKQDPNIQHIKFYCLNGDFSDGTFVVIDRYHAYADTINESNDNLLRLLKLLDFTKGYKFLSERAVLQSTIREVIAYKNAKITYDNNPMLYRLPKDEAPKLDVQIPDGIELRPVEKISDLEKADAMWPSRHQCSIHLFERMAKYDVNVGAFKDDGTLVAWVFRLPTGLLTSLQVDENYMRCGYGSVIVKHALRKIAELGHDCYAGVDGKNDISRRFFEKLGFKAIGTVYFIATKHLWSDSDEQHFH